MAVGRSSAARGQVYLVRLDPTLGSEIKKTRPCVVVSPDELNDHLRTVIVAPMTTGGRAYPWRPACRFKDKSGFVALDQLRTVRPGNGLGRSGALARDVRAVDCRCCDRSGQWPRFLRSQKPGWKSTADGTLWPARRGRFHTAARLCRSVRSKPSRTTCRDRRRPARRDWADAAGGCIELAFRGSSVT
jgi:mRNA interferase MazF